MRHKRTNHPVRLRLIRAGVDLFTKNGFTHTTNKMLVSEAKCAPGQFFNFFRTKENLLLEFVKITAPHQREVITGFAPDAEPEVLYCLELAIQLTICERDANLNDLYTSAYSLPHTLHHIKHYSYKKCMDYFGSHLPDWSDQDFYLHEILAAGAIYGCLMEPCTPYFTLPRKIKLLLTNLLSNLRYTEQEQEAIFDKLGEYDIEALADQTITYIHDKLCSPDGVYAEMAEIEHTEDE